MDDLPIEIRIVEELPELDVTKPMPAGRGRWCVYIRQHGQINRYALPAVGPRQAEVTFQRVSAGDAFDELWHEHGGDPVEPKPPPDRCDSVQASGDRCTLYRGHIGDHASGNTGEHWPRDDDEPEVAS